MPANDSFQDGSTEEIVLEFTDEEYYRILSAAQVKGVSFQDFVQHAVVQHITRERRDRGESSEADRDVD